MQNKDCVEKYKTHLALNHRTGDRAVRQIHLNIRARLYRAKNGGVQRGERGVGFYEKRERRRSSETKRERLNRLMVIFFVDYFVNNFLNLRV